MKIAKTAKIGVEVVVGLALLALIVFAFLPKPQPVQTATISKGPLVVTVDGDGRTRIKDRFVVSAPVAGQIERVALRPGDRIALGAPITVVTPIDPPLLDARSKAQAEAELRLARAGEEQAASRVKTAEAAAEHAKAELARMSALEKAGGIGKAALEDAQLAERTASSELDSARFGVGVARSQVDVARTAVTRSAGKAGDTSSVAVKSPVDGAILRVLHESAGVVAAGAPLVEIGDPAGLEIVLDVLSADAVAIRPAAETWIEHWGGDGRLDARVRLVEPSGFTKISALGVEEQRVNVVADFACDPKARAALGDGYRVHARVVVWQKPDAIRVPLSALFRDGDRWAVFVLATDRVKKRVIEIGHRGDRDAEVTSGLDESEQVVVHPSDRLVDGARVLPTNP
ncbi:MAG: HlyD family efflux transporter periplasmic adaptor subunit [Polyangiaceae bacterium]